jgi:tRNA-2-methylthio-N6-dimethylallyladenosine synthase
VAQKYFIETHGCQMNVHDSERIAGLLEHAGYERARAAAEADVVVINTCSVREHAEAKLYSRLGELRAEGQARGVRPTIAVAGCVAQQEQAALLRRSSLVDVVVGTQAIRQLPRLLADAGSPDGAGHALDVGLYEDVSFPLGIVRRTDAVRAWITIIEGCNDYCAFCVVPYTRGHERMRPLADILAEIRNAAAAGHREICLLGQIVNHYHAPDAPECDFAHLLERVHEIDGIDRIRFASPHPRHVTRRLIEVIRDLPKVCKHVHLPVQSGSNRILQAMRRRHTREWYLQLVDEFRREIPAIAFSTDVIVGFPGETTTDFEDTLELVRVVEYHSMFSFKYSPRPHTLALKRMPDDVAEGEKTRRIVQLQAVQASIQSRLHAAQVGRTVEVLVDSTSRRRAHELAGRSTWNTVVNFPGSPALLGRLVPVRIERSGPHSLWGRVVGADSSPALDSPDLEAYV